MKVLLIEDEKGIRDLICEALEQNDMGTRVLDSAMGAIEHIRNYNPDVILLDQVLPGRSGVELLMELRSQEELARIPVIMVTGLGGEDDQVKALEIGADDYVVKPFLPRALVARIKAVYRRHEKDKSELDSVLESGSLKIDFSTHRVSLNGQEVSLTLTEFKILGELLRENGKVLTRDRLRERALGNLNVTDRTIDVHMASLRKKLPGTEESIQTVRGVGYRFQN